MSRERKPELAVGDRVAMPGVKHAIYGRLVDIWEGKGVVVWDNGVLRHDVVLRHLKKAGPSEVSMDSERLSYPPDLDAD